MNRTHEAEVKNKIMYPVKFEGSTEIRKPENMTDEQCMSLWAKFGFGALMTLVQRDRDKDKMSYVEPSTILPGVAAGEDSDQYPYYITAWKPSYEDLQALNRGEPIYVKTLSKQLPPMALFTLDEDNKGNF